MSVRLWGLVWRTPTLTLAVTLCYLQGTQMIFNAAKELGQLSKLKVRPGVGAGDWGGEASWGERSQNGDMLKGQKPCSD